MKKTLTLWVFLSFNCQAAEKHSLCIQDLQGRLQVIQMFNGPLSEIQKNRTYKSVENYQMEKTLLSQEEQVYGESLLSQLTVALNKK